MCIKVFPYTTGLTLFLLFILLSVNIVVLHEKVTLILLCQSIT